MCDRFVCGRGRRRVRGELSRVNPSCTMLKCLFLSSSQRARRESTQGSGGGAQTLWSLSLTLPHCAKKFLMSILLDALAGRDYLSLALLSTWPPADATCRAPPSRRVVAGPSSSHL